MTVKMRRVALEKIKQHSWENAGLLFDRGLSEWSEIESERGKAFGEHLDSVCRIRVPQIYDAAYSRWLATTCEPSRFTRWFGKVEGRLFIGQGGAHALETQITRHAVYGIPIIPGTALKGLARAYAPQMGIDGDAADILFGKIGDDPGDMEAGYLIFHDAWWIPNSAVSPYTREIVTVHHAQWYQTAGKTPATDFDEPNPNQQVAAHGSFLFVIEGMQTWTELGMNILTTALTEEGIGGKVSSGYGYFSQDSESRKKARKIEDERNHAFQVQAESHRKRIAEGKKEAMLAQLSEPERILASFKESLRCMNCNRMSVAQKEGIRKDIKKILEELPSWPTEVQVQAARFLRTKGFQAAGFNKKQRRKREENLSAILKKRR